MYTCSVIMLPKDRTSPLAMTATDSKDISQIMHDWDHLVQDNKDAVKIMTLKNLVSLGRYAANKLF